MSVVPSLSTEGWLSSVDKKADSLLAHFFLSEYSQTVFYAGNVKSLPYIIAENSGSRLDLRDAISQAIDGLMRPYFDDIKYKVMVTDGADASEYEIKISATVFENGTSYDLAFLVKTKDSTVKNFMKINNGEAIA